MDQMDKEPPDKVMMSYEETFQYDEWETSRECADEMMRTIPRLKEDFSLDQITLGDGQCFSTACIQQMRRPDVNKSLDCRSIHGLWTPELSNLRSGNLCKHVSIQKFMI